MNKMMIIEAPCNLGLKEPGTGIEPGVKYFPDALDKTGFFQLMKAEERLRIEAPPYSMLLDETSKVRNAEAIIHYCKQLGKSIQEVLYKSKWPLIVGGDCSILIGAMLALKKHGQYGLFFIDGHTDYILPQHSVTGGAAGMDLAIVTGNGHDKLTNIEGLKPYVKEENVFCYGNRYYESSYVRLIGQSNIRYYDLNNLRTVGIKNIIREFLLMVKSKTLDGFWIHFDVDALNNDIMPCVDSPQIDGLSYGELAETLQPLISSSFFCGMEITILDPTLDKGYRFTKKFSKKLAQIISFARNNREKKGL